MPRTRTLMGCIAIVVTAAAGCGREPVDRFRELEIVDDEVVASARAKNARDGAFSFRHVARSLAATDDEASETVRDAFRALGQATSREIVCPWLREDPSNRCDETCSACAAEHLDLSRAPLRLLAISNRVDLGDMPDALSEAGEARFVYGVTRGPGDDSASAPRAMTVIVEYALPPTRTPGAWARAWHALGGLDGERYVDALEALTREITAARTLAQVRTNAASTEPDPGMRELALDDQGRFRPRPLRNTPEPSMEGSDALAAFQVANAAAILEDKHVLPLALRASRVVATGEGAPSKTTLATTIAVPDDVRRAFVAGTCDGCHGGEQLAVDDVFHVSPFRRGPEKLSRFLHDPSDYGADDLTRREADLRSRLGR